VAAAGAGVGVSQGVEAAAGAGVGVSQGVEAAGAGAGVAVAQGVEATAAGAGVTLAAGVSQGVETAGAGTAGAGFFSSYDFFGRATARVTRAINLNCIFLFLFFDFDAFHAVFIVDLKHATNAFVVPLVGLI
jgi:hypothetical protein